MYGSITPSSATPRRDRRGDRRASRPAAAARSAGPATSSRSAAAVVEHAQPPGRGDVGRHQRERLVLAVLAGAQRATAVVRRRQRGEVVAAEALDGDDLTGAQRRRRRRRSAHRARGPHAGQHTGWAWNRRSAGILVLGPARRAHGEAGHRRVGPVVRDGRHDRVPRPAVRAVRERVPEPPVGRIEQLAPGSRRTSRRRATRAWRPRRLAGADLERRCARHDDVDARRGDRRRSTASGGARSTTRCGERGDRSPAALRPRSRRRPRC